MYVFLISFVFILTATQCRPSIDDIDSFDSNAESTSNTDWMFDNEAQMHPFVPVKRIKRFVSEEEYNGDYFEETSSLFWNTRAQLTLRKHLTRDRNLNTAKNVILFLGDGMSIPTLTASRIYMGQQQGASGEESKLSFEEFPFVGLSKTYCVDKQVADSACSATAYLCGVKGNFYTIGVNGRVKYNDCDASRRPANQVQSLAAWAQRAGKGTGIVTTTTVTHASPSGTYAHVSNRNFECDADVKKFNQNPDECEDIASQLINNRPGNKFKVIFGGGRTKFIPKTENDTDGNVGERDDGVNLINEWKNNRSGATYIYDKEGLDNLDYNRSEHVLGLFSPGHMSFNLDANRKKEPSLEQLTESAIRLLQKEQNGFFLFVEGGRIDHGHHEAQANKAVDETVQFSEAIQKAVKLTNRRDTLIVVTSDHAHTMSIAGYPDRGNNILKLNTWKSDIDNLPYTTLSYANGPGYKKVYYNENGTRNDLTETEFSKNYTYPGTFPMKQETHGGDDVGVFALGCWSHLFSGVYEQNTIPHLIGYAACIGDGLTSCNRFS